MRLLSRHGNDLKFTFFLDDKLPPYAILSHTWNKVELSYQDVINGGIDKIPEKLDFCLEQAAKDGLEYVWMDSCCIDRRDKNELGEAINCMYKYYCTAEVCYVYLSDVLKIEELSQSKWFTRGWTLQEMLAPERLEVYSNQRQWLGNKHTLLRQIKRITNIDLSLNLEDVSIEKKFEWSLGRQTTKVEDISYCMLGLLEVTLIPNYGEGEQTAQERLLKEVAKEHGKKTLRKIEEVLIMQKTAPTPALLYERFLASLYFESMHSRRTTIDEPFPTTCSWLVQHPQYEHWASMNDSRFLWIKGKPGAGKSTLMKFAYEQSHDLNTLRISYFFNARGNDLDKSTIGMYRCLLHQMLSYLLPVKQCQKLQSADLLNHPVYQACESWLSKHGNLETAVLKALLRQTLTLSQHKVQCFIDALDECDTKEVQDMVYYFENLARSEDFFVCFASRFYPTITVKYSHELILDNRQHTNDIELYVLGRLDVPNDEQGNALVKQIITKSNGVFFWTILVVKLMNYELSRGNIFNVRKTLDALPAELSALLQDIVGREATDGILIASLRWIYLARMPLQAKEYYRLMLASLHDDGLVDDDTLNYTIEPTPSQLAKFVSSSSRGLAEITQSDLVQFVHETVREYLQKPIGAELLHAGHSLASIHDKLKRCCVSTLNPTQQRTTSTCTYAYSCVLYHADCAAMEICQKSFLKQIDYQNMALQSAQYERAREVISWQPLELAVVILAREGTVRLLKTARAMGARLDHVGHQPPLVQAIQRRDVTAIDTLLQCGVDINEVYDDLTALHHVLGEFIGGINLAGQHLRNCQCREKSCLDCAVSSTDRADLYSYFIDRGADPKISTSYGVTTLIEAIRRGHSLKVVRTILDAGVDIDAADVDGSTALMVAVMEQRADIVTSLVIQGADVHKQSYDGLTALQKACVWHERRINELRLKGYNTRTAIQTACGAVLLDLCDPLLQAGSTLPMMANVSRPIQHTGSIVSVG